MSFKTLRAIAGIMTALNGFFSFLLGLYNIQVLVETNQLIHLLAIITMIPGGIFLVYAGVKVVDP